MSSGAFLFINFLSTCILFLLFLSYFWFILPLSLSTLPELEWAYFLRIYKFTASVNSSQGLEVDDIFDVYDKPAENSYIPLLAYCLFARETFSPALFLRISPGRLVILPFAVCFYKGSLVNAGCSMRWSCCVDNHGSATLPEETPCSVLLSPFWCVTLESFCTQWLFFFSVNIKKKLWNQLHRM